MDNTSEDKLNDRHQFIVDAIRPKRQGLPEHNREDEQPINWGDIKEFVNSLTEEELKQQCFIWGDNESWGSVYAIQKLTQDMINPSGEGAEPISIYEEENESLQAAEQYDLENEPKAYYAGQYIIAADMQQ